MAGASMPAAYMKSMPPRTKQIPAGSCPICGKPAVPESRPFCSRRCADVDLNRWFSGAYAIPVQEAEDEDGVPRDDGKACEKPNS